MHTCMCECVRISMRECVFTQKKCTWVRVHICEASCEVVIEG